MLKDEKLIHLDEYGRVTVDDSELTAILSEEKITLSGAGGNPWNCVNFESCGGSLNNVCANFPGECVGSSNTGSCNPGPPPVLQ